MVASVDTSAVNLPSLTPATDDTTDPMNSALNSDYGPWLLVSRRRGLPRSRGGGVRTPSAAPGSAAVPWNENRSDRGSTIHRTRGGLRGGASGRPLVSHTTFHNSPCLDETAPNPTCDPVDPSVPSADLPITSRDPALSPDRAPRDSAQRHPIVARDPTPAANHLPPVPSPLPSDLHPTLNPPPLLLPNGNVPLVQRSRSPPPVLLTSLTTPFPHTSGNPNQDHSLLVNQVNAVLDNESLVDGSMDEGSDQEVCDSDDSDDQMSDGEEPDDLMTLDQYCSEARREALVRKGSLLPMDTQKKGRIERGEPSLS